MGREAKARQRAATMGRRNILNILMTNAHWLLHKPQPFPAGTLQRTVEMYSYDLPVFLRTVVRSLKLRVMVMNLAGLGGRELK